MADDRGETRTFNLSEAFLFPKLFRGFRIAIDYRKLLLALVAIGLFYGVGVLTDWIGGMFRGPDVVVGKVLDDNGRPVLYQGRPIVVSEVSVFASADSEARFNAWREQAETDRVTALAAKVNPQKVPQGMTATDFVKKHFNTAVGSIAAKIRETADADMKAAADEKTRIAIAVGREQSLDDLNQVDGQGVFEAFLGFEIAQFNKAASCLVLLDNDGPQGVWQSVVRMGSGLIWLGKYHWVYAIILGLAWLVLSSVFGGAIARLAAVQAARDEKISAAEALKFAIRKFVSFISAPLIPFVIVAIIFILTMCPAALAGIPFVGEIFVALLGWAALIAGFIMALVVIGGIGGMGMMHPTIAVEGSDAFDAISRGFSYVYSRPWRTIFYNGCAIVYGGLCFLFVKLFVFVMLWLTWQVMGALVWGGPAAAGVPGDIDKIGAMWNQPTLDNLHSFNWGLLQGWEIVGAIGLTIWVGIVISLLAAFVLSYVYSSQTLIYLLLRKRVDATDLDDVYIEESEEEELFEAPAEEKKEDKLETGPAPEDTAKPIGAEPPPAEGGEEKKPE